LTGAESRLRFPQGSWRAPAEEASQFALAARAHDPGTALIRVQGDVDLHVASLLGDALAEAIAGPAARIVIDLDRVTLFDSSAIHALLIGRSSADGRATRLAIVCTTPSILRVLEITRLPEVVPLYATVAQAADGSSPEA